MLGKLFGFDPRLMSVKKEVIAGITTFLTMAYVLAVNPAILADAGMDQGAVFTATTISTIVSTLVMAFYAKMPFSLAPAMGLNAFFAYTVVRAMGYSWQFALTAVCIEGIIFIILTLTGLRQMIVNIMPVAIRHAIAPGIGFFIAFLGLKDAGIVVSSESTYVTLGSLHDPGVLLSCFGIILSAVLYAKKVMGSLLIGIIVTMLLGIPLGITNFNGIVDTPPSLAPVFMKFEWESVLTFDMVVCVFTFLFIDMFNTIGTLVGVCGQVGMLDKDGNIPNIDKAFMADAVGTTVGAALGTSTVSTYVVSAAGISVGGKSGLTAFVIAICFTVSLVFAPVFLAIPPQATSAALFLVGAMMMSEIKKINFDDFVEAVPCFVCVVFMPLTYSISDGILMGLITYVLLRVATGRWREVNIGSIILTLLFMIKYAFL